MLAKYVYKKIKELLKEMPKANYMEIGSFDGEGIAELCKSFPDSKFYSVDPFIEDGYTDHITLKTRGEKIDFIKRKFNHNTKGLKNLTHFPVESRYFMTRFKNNIPDIHILFIDGDHAFESCRIDLNIALQLSRKNSLIVFMDDLCKDSVKAALTMFRKENKIKPIKINRDSIYFKL